MALMHETQDDVLRMHRLADAASAAIIPHFRALTGVDNKAPTSFDPVTVADREAEAAMRAILERECPGDGIHGEEYGLAREGAARRWILDPIDGTRAFVLGLPIWGILIALTVDGRARLGMMAQPFVGERFWSDGEASFAGRGGTVRRLSTRTGTPLDEASLLATSPDIFDGDAEGRFAALRRRVKTTRFGTDCYGFAMVAAGQGDLVVEASLHTYDIAAFIPIIEHAGGCVVGWTGGDALPGGRVIAAADRRLAEEAAAVLNA